MKRDPFLCDFEAEQVGGRLSLRLAWSDGFEVNLSGAPGVEVIPGLRLADFLLGVFAGGEAAAIRASLARIIDARKKTGRPSETLNTAKGRP